MMPEDLFHVRAEQLLAELDAFLKDIAKQGATIPQALVDAVEAFREAMKAGVSP